MWLVKSLLLMADMGSLRDFLGTPVCVCVWVCIEKIQGVPWVCTSSGTVDEEEDEGGLLGSSS